MALYTGGYKQDNWVTVAGGNETAAQTSFDIDWQTYRDNGYHIFKLFITDTYILDGDELWVRFLTADNSVISGGCYGGYFTHGETEGDITYNDEDFDNLNRLPLFGTKGANSSGGIYRANMEITINTGADNSTGVPNYWWHGTARIADVSAAHIQGAGTCTQNADYGIRLQSSGTNGILKCRYRVIAMKSI